MEGGLLLDVVVGQSTTIFQLLAGENQTLLIRRDTFLILNLGLDILNGVGWFDLQSDGLASQRFHEDLHATTQTEDKMEGGLLLDVVVGQSTTILQLLASKDETLLIGRDTFLILNLGLDIFNGVGWFHLQGDGLASEGLDKDLHATSETEHQMESRLLLDVVVGQGAAIFQLLASKDQPLLVRRDTFLVLDLGLDVLNRIAGLNFQSDGLASESFDKDLHATSEAQDKMERGLLLDVVVGQGAAILQLLAGEDQTLLVRGNALFVLDLGLDIFDGIAGLDLQSDGLASQGFDEDLHATSQAQDQVERRLLLDVVVGESATVFQLLAGENQTLLIRRDTFFVLDFGFDVFDAIRGFDLKRDGLARQGLHEDLHVEFQA